MNEEASRVLKFFMSTLLNGTMKKPKELEQMRSLTTVRIPCPHATHATDNTFSTSLLLQPALLSAPLLSL